MAATVLRKSALVSSTLDGLVPADFDFFFSDFSLSLSGFAMRVEAAAGARWLVGAVVATMNESFYLVKLDCRQVVAVDRSGTAFSKVPAKAQAAATASDYWFLFLWEGAGRRDG
jgi:hypothetical protein